MQKKNLLAILTAVSTLSACTPKHIPRDCTQATEIAFKFTERAISLQPKLAYTPVRNDSDAGLYWQACRNGLRDGEEGNMGHLVPLHMHIVSVASKPEISTEDGIYLLNDMAMYLAYKYGYELAYS